MSIQATRSGFPDPIIAVRENGVPVEPSVWNKQQEITQRPPEVDSKETKKTQNIAMKILNGILIGVAIPVFLIVGILSFIPLMIWYHAKGYDEQKA